MTILILTACNNQKYNQRIEQFENYLGSEKSAVLTKKVESFERFLSMNFKNQTIEENYIDFLRNIAFGDYENIDWKFEQNNRKELERISELHRLRQEIWTKPDSVWINDTVLICLSYYITNSDTQELFYKNYHPKYRNKKLNLDSTINAEKRIMRFNLNGKFYKGLGIIKDSDSTIIAYLDNRNSTGSLPPSIIANGFLERNTDFLDYFVKRIIMIQFYREIRLPTINIVHLANSAKYEDVSIKLN